MKKQVTRISVVQTSKIIAAFYFLTGFIYALIGIGMMLVGNDQFQVVGCTLILMPIFLGVFGFIFGVVLVGIYNMLAGWLGGVEFEVKDIPKSP